MPSGRGVGQVICPNCRTSASVGAPHCDRCGMPLTNLPVVAVLAQGYSTSKPPSEIPGTFLREGQDPTLTKQIFEMATRILMDGEVLEYIATGNKAMLGVAPDCVVATNRRLLGYKKKILGKVEL